MFDKLIIALISPLGTALALGGLALWLATRRRQALSLALGTVAVAWLLIWSLPVVSHRLRAHLEADHPLQAINRLPTADAIVVLGGSVGPAEHPGDWPNLSDAADRVWHAARLYHAGKAPLVLLTGGHDPEVSVESEAVAMQRFLRDLQVPKTAMLLEGQSRNTRQNAQFSAELLKTRSLHHILLVTSALHMPRALPLFEAQGLAVTPAATDHEAHTRFAAVDWLPDAGALDGSARALKELIGRWSGR